MAELAEPPGGAQDADLAKQLRGNSVKRRCIVPPRLRHEFPHIAHTSYTLSHDAQLGTMSFGDRHWQLLWCRLQLWLRPDSNGML